MPKPRVSVPGVRPDAGRSDPPPGEAPADEGAGLLVDEGAAPEGTGEEGKRPDALTFSPELEATAASLAAPEPPPPIADPAAAPPAAPGGRSLEQCQAEARLWVKQLCTLAVRYLPADRAAHTRAALADQEWQGAFAECLGEVMHFYGITAGDAAGHPLVKLAIVSAPLAVAAFLDWRTWRQLAAEANAAPTPATVARGPASTPTPPPDGLASRA